MKKILFSLLAVLALAACDKADKPMQCGAYEVSISMNNDEGETMNAIINGDPITLGHVISGSGAKYAGVLNDTDVVLWGKGQDWIMILNDGDVIECK